MGTSQPTIDVRLRVNPRTCDLSRQTRFSLVVLLTLHSERSVTVAKAAEGLDIGLESLLQSGTIQCIDTVSSERIPIFDKSRDGDSESKEAKAKRPSLLFLNNNKADYVTFTSATKPRDYELGFDTSHLQPNKEYTISCSPWDMHWWSYDSIEKCLDYFDIHGKLPSTQSPPLHCSPTNQVSFSCQEHTPRPPQVDVSLTASSTLSLSGNPPFKFSTAFTSHASQPFTALAQRSDDIAMKRDIEIIDATTKQRVAPDQIDICFEGLYERDDFVCLHPGKPHVEERSLSMKDGLEELQPGSEYILRFPDNQWRWWSFGSVDDVMRLGKGHESTEGFSNEFTVHLVCHDEVRFRAVE